MRPTADPERLIRESVPPARVPTERCGMLVAVRKSRTIRGIAAVALATGIGATAGSVRAAGTYRVDAFVQPAGRVTDSEPIQLTIRIQGANLRDVSMPRLPSLTNLRVVSGPSTSSEFSWVNGQASASSSLNYVLVAAGPGPAEVPALDVKIGSTVYRTEPIRLEVVPGQTGSRAPPRRPTGPGGGAAAPPQEGGGPDVFLRAELSRDEAWFGEPVMVSVTLFANVEVTNFEWRDAPSFSSFWTEDVAVDPSAERYRAEVGGRTYVAYPLQKKILVANSAGDLTIEPYTAQFRVRRAPGDVFSDLFSFGRSQDVIRKTSPLTLRVKRLPEQGRPASFGGAVGSFRMRAALDRKEAQVNDAVALKWTVEGDGFLRSVAPPHLDVSHDVKVFDPKVTESSAASGGKITSKKTWEWVLVPLVPGELRLPSPSFAYFDPQQGSYRELRADPPTLLVKRGEGTRDVASSGGELRTLRREVAFIKPLRGKLSSSARRTHQTGWFLTALLLPLFWVPAVIVLGRRRARLRDDRGFARSRRARTRARKLLRSTERRMAALDAGRFHEDVARALVEYVADRFDRSAAGLTYEAADELLESRGVDNERRARFRACLERCDFARFVPDAARDASKAEVLKEATTVVDLLEDGR